MVRTVGGIRIPIGNDRRKGISDNRDIVYCGKCGNKIKSGRFCGKCGYESKRATAKRAEFGRMVNELRTNLNSQPDLPIPDNMVNLTQYQRAIEEIESAPENGFFQTDRIIKNQFSDLVDTERWIYITYYPSFHSSGLKVRVSGDSKKDALDVTTRAYPILTKYNIPAKIGWNLTGVQKGKLLTAYIPQELLADKSRLVSFLQELETSMDGYKGNMPISGDKILGRKGVLSYRNDGTGAGGKYVANSGISSDIPNDRLKGLI